MIVLAVNSSVSKRSNASCEVGPADDDAVVLQQHAIDPPWAKTSAMLSAELVAAGQSVGGVADLAADVARLREQARRVGDLPADAEGDQGDRMRVDDGPQSGRGW